MDAERRGTLTTIGVKASGVPTKVGVSVPATFAIQGQVPG